MTATQPAPHTATRNWPPGRPRSLEYPKVPVGSILRAAVRRWGDREAFIQHDLPLTYTELGARAHAVAGWLADRFGGIRTLSAVYVCAALLLAGISTGPATLPIAITLFVVVMGTLGIGNGAVFQLVPQRFRKEIGVMTGLVGFAGGVGGFYLASSLGFAQKLTGSSSAGFLIFAGLALVALAGLTGVKGRWRTTWGAALQGARI